jgi:transposase-like protein
MPWKARDTMSLRREFVELAGHEDACMAELCRRFGTSRRVGYKWLGRFQAQGVAGLADRPCQTGRRVHVPTVNGLFPLKIG